MALARGTHTTSGPLRLYADRRDGNGPTPYDKNGGSYYRIEVQ